MRKHRDKVRIARSQAKSDLAEEIKTNSKRFLSYTNKENQERRNGAGRW